MGLFNDIKINTIKIYKSPNKDFKQYMIKCCFFVELEKLDFLYNKKSEF